VQGKIDRANDRLDKIKIKQRGTRLILRATLPPKAGQGSKNKQFTISTGLPSTPEGLKLALIEAQKIEGDLIYGRFSWGGNAPSHGACYTPWDEDRDKLTVAIAIQKFEDHHWQKREKTPNTANTYKYDYLNHFLYLPQDKLLTADLLVKVVKTTIPDSRKRRGMGIAYGALLNYFEIENDLTSYKGNYSPTKKRIIPSLEDIDKYYAMMKSPQWRWVFGIIASYGIRPHEIFHLDCSMMMEFPPVLMVGEKTKTGSRLVYPLPDETRARDWKLHEAILPNIDVTGKSNMALGQKVSQHFWEAKIPSPYHFRDAYAIQGAVRHCSPALVAQWMGHDLKTHYQKYLRHISKSQFNDAWLSLQRPPK
jgi:integrase